jgi:hypothetical protein
MAYNWFLTERISYGAIARRLNDADARPAGGGDWYSARIQWLLGLGGASYTGYAVIGRRRLGRYFSVHAGRVAVSDRARGARPRSEWTWSRAPTFSPPIVSREDWEAVQEKMGAEKRGARRGKNPAMVLSGLVVCSGCGKAMAASAIRRRGRAERLVYQCSSYLRHHGHPPSDCRANQVRQDLLLDVVGRWLQETGQTLADVSGGDETGLLAGLYAERSAAREGLREAR